MGGTGEAPTSPPVAELIDFALERGRHRRFVGREDVLARLDEWLLGSDDTGWVVVTGGPGMGKSAILSKWLDRREATGAVVPHHFIRRQVIDWDQPERIAASLAAQIEAMFPDEREGQVKPEQRLPRLLGRVSKCLGATGRLMIVVDGLDETRAEPGENPLLRFLPHVIPPGIRILCTTRPTYPHLGWLEARGSTRRVNLDDKQWAASNEVVVRGFWEAVAPDYQPPLPAATLSAAIDRAGGNVLHAVMLHDALRDLPLEQRRAEHIPSGLRHLIGEIWDRAAATESVRTGLGLLCAAQEALSLDTLAEIAAWTYDDKQRFVREARQLLLEEPAWWCGADAYRPRHDWVRELIVERLGGGVLRAHHATMAQTLARWPSATEPTMRRYALRHALLHRVEARALAEAWQLAADMAFLEAKCRELGVHEVEKDVRHVAERCRVNGDEALRDRFNDLAQALSLESHRLRAAPEATASLVWNRLRQLGWSTDELTQQLRIPDGAKFLRVRHVATRESAALVRHLVGHAASVEACAITPDGRHVISTSANGTLKVWELISGREVVTFSGHTDLFFAHAVMPDGRRVVSASRDDMLTIWEPISGRTLATLKDDTTPTDKSAETPDGKYMVSVSQYKARKVWRRTDGHAAPIPDSISNWVDAYAVTPDGRYMISASWGMTLKVRELPQGRVVATLKGHNSIVTACATTPDGRHLITASWDGTLKVWELPKGHVVATLKGHTSIVTACVVTPDGQRVISASWDRTLKIWELPKGRAVATLKGHTGIVTACAVTPDGQHVVSASWDKNLKVWELPSGNEVATLEGHTDWVHACAVTPDSRYAVSASEDGTLKVWDLARGREVSEIDTHIAWVHGCAIMPDGKHAISASEDGTLKIWDLASGRVVATREDLIARFLAFAVTPDGRQIISTWMHNRLFVRALASNYIATANDLADLTHDSHIEQVNACAVTPDSRFVISASRDTTLKVWDLASRRAVATLEGHAATVLMCAVAPDGKHVVSASGDTTLKVWDLESGREVATLEGHSHWVWGCAVTPDGEHVVSASQDGTLKVWELPGGREVTTLEGHTDWVYKCAVTPDGRYVVSTSHDLTLKIWDLRTGACLLTHRTSTRYVSLATTSTVVVAGDTEGTVWFFDLPSFDAHPARRPPMKHTILFLAANPVGTDRLGLDREARAIQIELERSGFRDSFTLETRWAAEPLDLLRELRKLKPTIVHFSGHGGPTGTAAQHGLLFQRPDGQSQHVLAEALEQAFDAAGSSVKLVVLNACYSELQAKALLTRVDCVVGMRDSISDDAARSFSIGFYGGLGEGESITAAYKQGCAAIDLEGLREADRPQLRTRDGVDAATLVRGWAEQASREGAGEAPDRQPTPQSNLQLSSQPHKVDIGILTIRDDEFRAVLAAFPDRAGMHKGASREYTLRHADAGDGKRYRVAVARLNEQGNGEAQDAARDLIDDLAPRLVLVVGIAGAPPSDDVKLGDVVLSTRIHDFTVEARKAGQDPTYAVTGGPIDKALASFVSNLAAREHELGPWTADLPPPPPVAWESALYGPTDWQRELREKLAYHHAAPTTPAYCTGPIAASDRLVKDPELLIPWLRTARDLRAIEMESAGVYRAVRNRCPMLAIRGISDIVGLKRADAWTKYACASAAAFTRGFLRTRPIGDPL